MNSIFDQDGLREYLLETFQAYGIVIRNDHFVYASGKHGDAYVNKDAIYTHPELLAQVTTLMALTVRSFNVDFTVVVGPALGGIPLAQMVAQKWLQLFGEKKKIAVMEKDGEDSYILKRGYDQIVRNERILLVEDILTTGKSIALCIKTLRKYHTEIVHIVNIWQRGENINTDGIPFTPLMKEIFPMYDAEACPLCRASVPVNTALGKGAQFLKSRHG
jgi:orotate phosphoribosyltransferase